MQEKLKKIAEHVKRGVGAEKESAEAILKALCVEHNLDYEAVLNDLSLKEYQVKYRGFLPKEIAIQLMCRYAMNRPGWDGLCSTNPYYIWFTTTEELYQEFLVAMNSTIRLYKKSVKEFKDRQKLEKKCFNDAFVDKHDLYYQFPLNREKKPERKLTDEDLKKMQMIMRMTGEMGGKIVVNKQLGSGKN